MGEIKRSMIIEEPAIQAPLDLAKNFGALEVSIDGTISKLKTLESNISKSSSTTKLTKETKELTVEQVNLSKIQKQIADITAKNSAEYLKEVSVMEKLKRSIKERTVLGDKDSKSLNAQNASLKQLKVALEKNTREYDEMAAAEREASEEGKNLLKVINQQDADVKKLDGSTGRFQKNVGNYPNSLGKAEAALGSLAPGFSGMANGIATATKASIAFLGTGLGLALAAILLVLAPVISFLKNTGDGMDFVEEKASGLKNGLGFLRDSFSDVGKKILDSETGIVKFAKGMLLSNPIIAQAVLTIGLLRKAFPALAKGFDEAVASGEEFARVMDEINTAREFFAVSSEAEENAIKRLILQSKNRSASEQERLALIDEALGKESALSLTRVKSAESELGAIVNLVRTRSKLIQDQFETEEQFALRLAENFDHTDEAIKKQLLESLVNLERARGEDIAITEKLLNQRDALLDAAEAKAKKREEERLALATRINNAIFELEAIRIERQIKGATGIDDRIKHEIELEDLKKAHLLDNDKLIAKEREVIEQHSIDKINEINKKGNEERAADSLKLARQSIELSASLQSEQLDDEVNRIKQAVINGNLSRAEGDKALLKLKKQQAQERISIEIEALEKQRALTGQNADEIAKIDTELYKLRQDLVEAYYNNLEEKEKTVAERVKIFLDKWSQSFQDFVSSVGALLQSFSDRRMMRLDEEQEANEEQKDKLLEKEKSSLERSLQNDTLTAEQKDALKENSEKRQAAIEFSAERRQKDIEARRKKEQRKAAIFEKAVALAIAGIKLAQAIASWLAVVPLGFGLSAAAAVIGAVQLAAIAAKPIPAAEKGLVNHKGGAVLAGEKGDELIKSGNKWSMTSGMGLYDVAKGSHIFPHEESMRMIAMSGLTPERENRRVDRNADLKKELRGINKTIRKKPVVNVTGYVTGYNLGSQRINYLNSLRNK